MSGGFTENYIATVLFGCSLAGFVFTILGMTSVGVIRANGWVLLALYGAFALAYGYLLFLSAPDLKGRRAAIRPFETCAKPKFLEPRACSHNRQV